MATINEIFERFNAKDFEPSAVEEVVTSLPLSDKCAVFSAIRIAIDHTTEKSFEKDYFEEHPYNRYSFTGEGDDLQFSQYGIESGIVKYSFDLKILLTLFIEYSKAAGFDIDSF